MSSERFQPNTVNFWRNFAVDFAVGAAFLWFGVSRFAGPRMQAAEFVLGGLLAWPLLEYLFHRWLMHGPVPLFRKAHAMHHGFPHVTPATPWYAHTLAGLPVWALLAWISSGAIAALLTTGLFAGYTWFRVVHRTVHFHAQTVAPRFFEKRLRIHALHHAHPEMHFGVTTSILDRVFGTFRTS